MKAFLETWRDIEGYEGLYQVSDFGEVRSLKYGKTKLLKPKKETNGYLRVGFYKDSKQKWYLVHRLVATAFIENPDNLPEVNHIDEDKTNNVVANIEYCDHKRNCNHGTRNERSAKARINSPKHSKKPVQLTLDYIFVKEWESVSECGRNGFSQTAISKCCNNKYGKQGNVYKGYRFVFAEDYYGQFA